MNYEKIKAIISMLIIVLALLLLNTIVDAKQRPYPYHFQNANVYAERGKTYIEWYNIEPGIYGVYEYKRITYSNGRYNLIPRIVWVRFTNIGNVRLTFNRTAIRWKVIHISP